MKTFIYIIIPVILLTTSCSKETSVLPGPKEIILPQNGKSVVQSMNDFGFDLFKTLVDKEENSKNIFISPTSISLALAMTWNGAENATEDSMAYALRMSHLTNAEINETYRDLIIALTTCDEKVLLEIANSIWYRNTFLVEPDFLAVNNEYFNAEIASLDFNSPLALETINGWVSENTHDKIPTILDQIDPEAIMYLVNAIYFKGIWKIDFNTENTHEANFILSENTAKKVNMMNFEEKIQYSENDLFQACELDYGNGNFSMVVLLPRYGKSTASILENFSTENWDSWMNSFDTTKVNLSLPRFKFSYDNMLNSSLTQMGMGIAFSERADFSGINPAGGIYIGYVKHKSFIEVNEEGTEAAAATIVGMYTTAVPPDTKKYMEVNRPFLFAIREKTSNTIVFLGRVVNPEE